MNITNNSINGYLAGKKRVSWKGSGELISMQEIEPYNSTTTHSTPRDLEHDIDHGGGTIFFSIQVLEWLCIFLTDFCAFNNFEN